MARTRGNCLLLRDGDGKYLLQFRDDTPGIKHPLMWDFFGGGNEDGEKDLDAALRELHEELGIEAQPGELRIVDEFVSDDLGQVFVFFTRTIDWGEFTVNEGAGCGFFTPVQIEKLNVPPYIREFSRRLPGIDAAMRKTEADMDGVK